MKNRNPLETNLGYRIAEELIHNDYLKYLYGQLLEIYAQRIAGKINLGIFQDTKEIIDALRFTDLSCKSFGHPQSYKLKQIGQQMLLILIALFPGDERVSLFAESILASLGNFKGLESVRSTLTSEQFSNLDLNEKIEISLRREVLRVPGKENEFFLPDQLSIYTLLRQTSVSYSGPTSMGKSYIFRNFLIECLRNKSTDDFAIVVPSKALINETKKKLLRECAEDLSRTHYKIVTSSNDLALKSVDNHYIFVMTPERLINLLTEHPYHHLGYIFIDEAQKIVSFDKRNAFYFKLLTHPALRNRDINYIFASPNIPNPDLFSELLDKNIDLKSVRSIYSPVSQFIYLVDFQNNKMFIHNLIDEKMVEISQPLNTNDWVSFINNVGNDKKNLVYCNSKTKTIEHARLYAEKYGVHSKDPQIQNKRVALSKMIRNEIHGEYYLADLVELGIAFHASFLPERFRELIELGFQEGILDTIFCTSTLLEGVNLPADNLFITSPKNGRSALTSISFKNLVGRSGRLEFNLSGNVYLLSINDNSKEVDRFRELVSKPVEHQTLSISKIDPEMKRAILSDICDGNLDMPKVKALPKSKTDDAEVTRRIALTLIRDLASSEDSYLIREFRTIDTDGKMNEIKQDYPIEKTSENITISYDQEESIKTAVKNGLRYPDHNAQDLYSETLQFLMKLNQIFKWEQYERTLTNNSLSRIAVLLKDWIRGKGINMMINSSIWYHSKNNYVYNPNTRSREPFDGKDVQKKNWIIQDTLETIENTLLFSIANYFRAISLAIKEEEKVSVISNDWYEFVEFGTCNEKSIFLQKLGFSRDSSQKILKQLDLKLRDPKDEAIAYLPYTIPKELLSCNNEQVLKEANEVYINMPEAFSR